MCMLTYYPPGVGDVDEAALDNGAWMNKDGHGFAIVNGNEIIVDHSLAHEPLIERFAKLRKQYPDGPALFHSRWGTSGKLGLFNCHPFYVNGSRNTVLAHNGVMPRDVHPKDGDKRCDTRLVAENVIDQFGILTDAQRRAAFVDWLTPSNKVLILTTDARFKSNVFLFNESAGVWDEPTGIWYSNDDYLGWIPQHVTEYNVMTGGQPPWWETTDMVTCSFCQCETPTADRTCIACKICFRCWEMSDSKWCTCPPDA